MTSLKYNKKRAIKNPTFGGGVWGITEFLTSEAKNTRSNYTLCLNNCNTGLNTDKTVVKHSNTTVLQVAKTSKIWQTTVNNLIINLENYNFISIIVGITSSSGMNRTRQQAVFLRPLYFAYFSFLHFIYGLCYKLKTVYGGLREGNINNTFRRLDAVIETCHPIKVVVLLNRSGA